MNAAVKRLIPVKNKIKFYFNSKINLSDVVSEPSNTTLQVFDIDTKSRLREQAIKVNLVFWSWVIAGPSNDPLSSLTLALVTPTDIFHWLVAPGSKPSPPKKLTTRAPAALPTVPGVASHGRSGKSHTLVAVKYDVSADMDWAYLLLCDSSEVGEGGGEGGGEAGQGGGAPHSPPGRLQLEHLPTGQRCVWFADAAHFHKATSSSGTEVARRLSIVLCQPDGGLKVVTFDLATFEADEEGHWTELGLMGDVAVMPPVDLACATLNIPPPPGASQPGPAAPVGLPQVWLDAIDLTTEGEGDAGVPAPETFWVVQRNGSLKVITIGAEPDAQWAAEEGFQSTAAQTDDAAAVVPLVLCAVRDVSRPAALMVLAQSGTGSTPSISRVRLTRGESSPRKLSL